MPDDKQHNGKPVVTVQKPTPEELLQQQARLEAAALKVENWELKNMIIQFEHPRAVERLNEEKARYELLQKLAQG